MFMDIHIIMLTHFISLKLTRQKPSKQSEVAPPGHMMDYKLRDDENNYNDDVLMIKTLIMRMI